MTASNVPAGLASSSRSRMPSAIRINRSLFARVFAPLLVVVASPAYGFGPNHEIWADVIASRPVYHNVETRVPQRLCRIEQIRDETFIPGRNNTGGTLAGGVVGGALGHAVGHGDSNQKIGAAVGAVLGAVVGNRIAGQTPDRTHVAYRDVERCEIRERLEVHEELVGYDVTYRYDGRDYTTRTHSDPGNRIRLVVVVTPVEP